jgi:hypothetical protein
MALTDTTKTRTWNDKFTKIISYYLNEDGAAPAISSKKTPGGPFRIMGIRVNSDADITNSENLTITMDIKEDAAFDHVLFTKDLSTVISATDLFYEYLFDPKREYAADDAFTIAFANTDANNVAIEVLVEVQY